MTTDKVLLVDDEVEFIETLAERLRGPASARSGLQVMVTPFAPKPAYPVGQGLERFVVTAFGKDKPGIIRRFTEYMAGKDINIIDLYGSKGGEEFMLIAQVEVPGRWSVRMIQDDLEEMGREEGFTVRFQHENVFVATNQLRFTPSRGR